MSAKLPKRFFGPAILLVLVALIASCGPAGTPVPGETPQVIEKPVVQTVVVEKEKVVEKPVVQTVIVQPTTEAVGWSDRTFVIANYVHPKEIDPMGPGVSTTDIFIKQTLYETLVEYDPNTGQLVGVLATDWQASPDAKVYTFKLREGVKFHDGSLLTAEAVKLSFERAIDQGFTKGSYLRDVDTVEAVDDLTVRVNLKEPSPIFMGNIPDIYIASADALKAHFKDDWFLTHEAGSSAYMLKSFEPGGELIQFDPFPDYWRGWGRDGFLTTLPQGAKHLGRIESRNVPEPATARLLAESGEVHALPWYPISYFSELRYNPVIKSTTAPSYRVSLLPLNVAHGPLKDIRLRQMLQYAFPYDAYLQYYAGFAEPAVGPITPRFLSCPGLKPYTQDLEKAKALLAEAGYKPGELTLSYIWPTGGGEEQKQPGILLQDALRQIGVNLTVETIPWANIVERVAAGADKTPDIMTLINAPKSTDPGAAFLLQFYHSSNAGKTYNWGRYINPEFDKLLDEAMATPDQTKRYEMYCKAQDMVLADATHVYLAYPPFFLALNTDVGGFWMDPIGVQYFPWYDMYWTK
jgi:peptide/nickel transport system substrate-binding protein